MAGNWYVGKNGNRTGPFTSAQVQKMAAAGELRPTDMLWNEGMVNWVPAGTVEGLFPSQPAPAAVTPAAMNPYAAPSASEFPHLAAAPFGGTAEYAEFLPRVGAALLDGLFQALMICIPACGIGFGFMLVAGNDQNAQATASVFANCCAQIVSLVIGLVYCVVLETSPKQGTWGKQIVGIKVTDMQGNRITAGRAIGRYFAKLITGLTCGIGLLMPLFTEKKQTLHDMIAGCLALKK